MLIPLIALCIGVILYAALLLLFGNSPRERVRSRLDRLAENVELEYVHDAVLNEKKKTRRKKKQQTQLISRRFEDTLAGSGLKFSAQEFILLWAALSIGPGLIGALLRMKVIAILGLCIIGFAIPPIMVSRSRSQRQQLFNKQLGESLTIMSNCMRSGYSFQQALSSIAKEMPPPISTEFGRVVREMNYGTSMEQALNNLVVRADNKDLELLVSAVITSMQVGANLSEILDTISETISDRIKLRNDVRVASAQGRISGIVIGLLPVGIILILMVLNPGYMEGFLHHPIGRVLLILSVVLEATGFFIINRIVDIKY